MSTPTNEALVKKAEQVNDILMKQVYTPAFIGLFNKKAADVGLPGITNEQELDTALNLAAVIQANVSSQEQNVSNHPLNKMAMAIKRNVVSDSQRFAAAAANSTDLLRALNS
jgi:hypothetical protein